MEREQRWALCGYALIEFTLYVHKTSTLSIGGKVKPSFVLNCSDELDETFRAFFLVLGGATGTAGWFIWPPPVDKDDVILSVVFEWASFVLAMTSGSWKMIFSPDETELSVFELWESLSGSWAEVLW